MHLRPPSQEVSRQDCVEEAWAETDGTHRRECATFLMVSKGLADMALGIGIDGEVGFKTTALDGEDDAAEAHSFLGLGRGDGKHHQKMCLRFTVLRAGKAAGRLAKDDLR